jgi:hypothetical protein
MQSATFEIHLTVKILGTGEEERFRRWADAAGFKCLFIQLDRGATPAQPMLTWHCEGSLASARTRAEEVRALLAAARFFVTRVKIETALNAPGVPQEDATGLLLPETQYFEHHVKLALPVGLNPPDLPVLVRRHGAQLSRNALCHAGAVEERFVTQRSRAVGRPSARRQLDGLLEALAGAGHAVLEVKEEFVLFDSNTALDRGWIGE